VTKAAGRITSASLISFDVEPTTGITGHGLMNGVVTGEDFF